MPFQRGNTVVGHRYKPGHPVHGGFQPGNTASVGNKHNWRGNDIGYGAAHLRVKTANGPASAWLCATCGKDAREWAYLHNDPNECHGVVKGRNMTWSPNPEFYIPMCGPCHRSFDAGRV